MTLVNVNPRKKVRRSNTSFDHLFNELFNTGFNGTSGVSYNRPAVNVIEAADSFRIELSAPGLNKKDFEIGLDKDVLTIAVNKESKESEKAAEQKFIKREFNFTKFKRTFRLPDTVDTTKIDANFKNGILTLTLAKKEEAKELPPRTIKIK